jgi:Tol biopolymer transport system component
MKKTLAFFIATIMVGPFFVFAQKTSLPSVQSVHDLFSDDMGIREDIFFSVFEHPGGFFGEVDWCRAGSQIIFYYLPHYEDPHVMPAGRAYVINADGTGLRPFSNDNFEDFDWSPDCSQIAFSWGEELVGYQVYKVNTDGTNRIQLTTEGGTFPAWSPDGTRIAFCHEGIWVMSSGGGGLIQLIAGDYYAPTWSPDGTKIACSSRRSGSLNIWLMNADGTNLKPLTTKGGGRPDWSPDGKWIGFTRAGKIWVVSPDGKTEGMLRTAAEVADFSWSPDSKKIVFQGIVDLKWDRDLYVITLK